MTTGILGLLGGLLGLLLWWLKSRDRDSPKVRRAKKTISKARANVRKIRHDLQTRDMEALEADLDRQERDLDVLRSLHKDRDKTNE